MKSSERPSATPNFSGNTGGALRGASSFSDTRHWDELFERHAERYTPVAWDVLCTVEAMRRWLDRLDLREAEYVRMTVTPLQDFIDLNPAWPLRAWLGTVLEIVEERAPQK